MTPRVPGSLALILSLLVPVPASPQEIGGIVTYVLLDKAGAVRYPALHDVDVGVNKPFHVGAVKLTARLDVFNVANINMVIARRVTQNSSTTNQVNIIVAPRVIRFGVRVNW